MDTRTAHPARRNLQVNSPSRRSSAWTVGACAGCPVGVWVGVWVGSWKVALVGVWRVALVLVLAVAPLALAAGPAPVESVLSMASSRRANTQTQQPTVKRPEPLR